MEINKIYNEDCIDGMKKIPSASIDMVLTDPPYTSPTVHAFGRQKVNRLSDLAIQEFYFAEIKKEWEYMFCFSKGKPKTCNPIKVPCKYAGQTTWWKPNMYKNNKILLH